MLQGSLRLTAYEWVRANPLVTSLTAVLALGRQRWNGALLRYISHATGLLMHCYIVSLETRTNDAPLTPAQPCHMAVLVAALLLAVGLTPAGARVAPHTQRAANRQELAPVFDQYASLITSATHLLSQCLLAALPGTQRGVQTLWLIVLLPLADLSEGRVRVLPRRKQSLPKARLTRARCSARQAC